VSRENVEHFRRINDAYNRRDIEGFLEYCDPDIEFRSTFSDLGGGVYHGHHGMREWHREQEEAWDAAIWSQPEAFFDLGDWTVMFNVLGGRGSYSGAGVERREALVAQWRDGRIVRLAAYADREAALRAVGVSGASLTPIDP